MRCKARGIAAAVMVMTALAVRCNERDPSPPPEAASKPVAPVTASQPTTQPAPPEPADGAVLDPHAVQIPEDSWLRIERLEQGSEGGWANGHCPTRNKIVIETQQVAQFSMDLSQLDIDWSKQLWVRIDLYGFELKHKRNPVIHLQATSDGGWELVKPP